MLGQMVLVESRRLLDLLLGHIDAEALVVRLRRERPPRNREQFVADTEEATAREQA